MIPNAQLISGFAGVLLSLAFSYAPKLRTWFAARDAETKSLIMLVCLLVVTLALFIARCNTFASACFIANWQDYAGAFGTALVLNQGTYTVTRNIAPATTTNA